MAKTRKRLSKELLRQDFSPAESALRMEISCKNIAEAYSITENAIAVLSDMHKNASNIYWGGFASVLGLEYDGQATEVPSIWEENIFRCVHPDDLEDKHLSELLFFNYVRRRPPEKWQDYCMMTTMRMRNQSGAYIPVLHRMVYFPDVEKASVRYTLCLYTPLLFAIPMRCVVVNSAHGTVEDLSKNIPGNILSRRELQVLSLIAKGLTSKEIANRLSISKNTVSRHRQEILAKLQVKNSIEACRIAKELKLF